MAVKILTVYVENLEDCNDRHDKYTEATLDHLISEGWKITNVVSVPNGNLSKIVYILQDRGN